MSDSELLKQLSQFQSRADVRYMGALNKIERNSYIIMALSTGYMFITVILLLG